MNMAIPAEPDQMEEILVNLEDLIDSVKKTFKRRPRLLSDSEAAEYIGMSESWLRKSRSDGVKCQGPDYIEIGGAVRYDIKDLDGWIDSRLQRKTASIKTS